MAKNDNVKDFTKDIADAIRAKKGTTALINPQNFSDEIASIETGITPEGTLEIRENGIFNVAQYSSADVLVAATGGEGGLGQAFNSGVTIINDVAGEITTPRRYAFYDVRDLEELYLPGCISFPNTRTICDCPKLRVLSLPNIETLSTSGTNWLIANLPSLSEIRLPKCSVIGSYCFSNISGVTTIDLPECVNIGQSAFNACYNLTSISAPKCKQIGGNAFLNASKLTSIDFPECTNIGGNVFGSAPVTTVNLPKATYVNLFTSNTAITEVSLPAAQTVGGFQGCTKLQNVSLPECTRLSYAAFANCTKLASIYLPKCQYVGDFAFSNCTGLNNVSLPVATQISSNAFKSCSTLTQISLPECTELSSSAFYGCSALERVFCSKMSMIRYSVFYGCSKLSAILLESTQVATLQNMNAFFNTPMSNSTYLGKFGSIFVPADLVDTYKASGQWSFYADRITSIDNFELGFNPDIE